jgi:hypothetical protein
MRARCGDDTALRGEVESLLSVASEPVLLDFGIAPEELIPSAVIAGRFRIVGLIGRGGMGEVYEAEDLKMGDSIAKKTIRRDLLLNPQSTELFKREINSPRKSRIRMCAEFTMWDFIPRQRVRIKTGCRCGRSNHVRCRS